MKILFYTVSNKRSRDIESQALLFSKSGHQVYLLTQNSRSELHDFFEQYGFQTGSIGYASSVLPFFIVVHIFYFLRFCNKNKINIAYSHLDSCSLISVLAQFFTSTRVVVCRHHADALIYETNWKGQWISKMIYKMARAIIAVSQNAKEFMVRNESISQNKISVIPLSFDFDLYPLPNKDEVNAIRNKFKADLLLITVGRFTSLKRIDHIIDLVNILHTQGADVKLLIVGDGPDASYLRNKVMSYSLEERIIFIGYVSDVLGYIAAADVYIHFSISEASCTTVKEAGIVSKPVIVCKTVGDFGEYINNEVDGWLVDKDKCIEESLQILQSPQKREQFVKIGSSLNLKVLTHFNIQNVSNSYEKIHSAC